MNPQDYGKEMYELIHKSVENTMNMLSMMQAQNEKFFNLVTEHTLEAQTEGRKMLDEWVKKGKEAQDAYKKMLEDNLKKVFDAGKGK